MLCEFMNVCVSECMLCGFMNVGMSECMLHEFINVGMSECVLHEFVNICMNKCMHNIHHEPMRMYANICCVSFHDERECIRIYDV